VNALHVNLYKWSVHSKLPLCSRNMQSQISSTNHLEDRTKHNYCAFKQVLEIDGVTLLSLVLFGFAFLQNNSLVHLLSNTVTLCHRWFEYLHLT
jgi:hypothetical protein